MDDEVVKAFLENKSKRKRTFLEEEKRHGKGGWEEPYEKKWNLGLHLDLGTIGHGIRSI